MRVFYAYDGECFLLTQLFGVFNASVWWKFDI